MNKKLLLVFLLSTVVKLSSAQSPCGSIFPPEMTTWLNDYVDHPEKYPYTVNSRSLSYIPIKFHLVGTSEGTGYYNMKYLWPVLCELNQKYAPVGFYFYIYEGIDHINNDDYYNQDLNAGFDMMYSNNVEGVVNVYVVHDAAGYCGYYAWGPDAVSIATNCMNPGSTTLAHELGHYFSLPHPFDNVNGIAEFVDESNCTSGGDLFCDTRADFLDYRWTCPYVGNKTDAHGDLYDPDETLFMSYSYDNCQTRFSDQQINAMVNYLINNRGYLFNHPVPSFAAITDPVEKISPENNATSIPNDWVEFVWDPVPNATFYQIQVTKYLNFYAPLTINQLVFGNSFTAHLDPDKTYYWRLQPLSEGYTCTDFSIPDTFTTVLGTGISSVVTTSNNFKIYPTIGSAGNSIHLMLEAENSSPSEIKFISMEGKTAKSIPVSIVHCENNWKITTTDLAPGMYLMNIFSDGKIYQQKVILTN